MWLFVFFDLPVVTKKERKIAATFRKNLMKDGFVMLQFSVYIRHCASKESQAVHIKRVKSIVPETGMVSILSVTDKQYGVIVNFWGKEKKKNNRTIAIGVFLVNLPQKSIISATS
jgi:CRISPR-associated protein Cas2